ncbi:MAG TPA: hypothetical protein VFO19_11010 [Vicinamibacterales bacterium]|nr:hypothetical protein [Vicinamibacterales bacterium]
MSVGLTPLGRRLAATFVLAIAVFGARWIDAVGLVGTVRGDEATYVAMAFSIAGDGDLGYDRRDYERFRRLYTRTDAGGTTHAIGPEGIFLKRGYRWDLDLQAGWPPVQATTAVIPETERLEYGKAFVYPLFAAPFAAVGGLGGMLVFNVLLLALCAWCAVKFCQAQMGKGPGAVLGLAFVFATSVPVFATFLTSEIFNFALVFVAYFLWLYKKVAPLERGSWLSGGRTTLVAALLLGLATFSKPPNVLFIVPLGLDLLRERAIGRLLAAAVFFLAGSAGLFAANAAISGEWNYQGAARQEDRRYFVTTFPFDDQGTPFYSTKSGAMTTNDADTGTVLTDQALGLFPRNAFYFLVGRDAGLVPYFFPGVLIAACWIAGMFRAPLWQWLTALATLGATIVLLIIAPYIWNGGGGPPGNRYFLSLYPALLFLVRPGLGFGTALAAAIVGVAFTGAMMLHPFAAAAATWRNVERAPLRWLPIELTIVEQLPVRLHPLRARVPFVRGPDVYLYYMDANTYYAEGKGFWIAGDAGADIVVRTEQPVTRIQFTISSRVDNVVTCRFGGRENQVKLTAGQTAIVQLMPQEHLKVEYSYNYVLRLETTAGFVPAERDPGSTDTRHLGAFIKPVFMYGYPPAPLGQIAPPPDGG